MGRDPRIDQYIAAAADFARPILETIRARVHAACPEVEETIKWSRPCFTCQGEILCGMAAFKAHAMFGIWRGAGLMGEEAVETGLIGRFGDLTAVDQLPPEAEMIAMIRAAAEVIERGERPQRAPRVPKAEIPEPEDFSAALDGSAAAQAGWAGMPLGARREYLKWIVGAKRAETRAKRIAQAVAQLEEGKKLNWKYENC